MVEINAQNWREFIHKPTFRLLDDWGGRKALQRYEGWFGYPVWKTLYGGPFECADLAEDLLAVAEGRMTREEQEKRHRARLRAAKKAKKAA